MRTWPVLFVLVIVAACGDGSVDRDAGRDAGLDAGRDAGRDTERDAGRDARADIGIDGSPADGGGAGWRLFEGLPDVCRITYAENPERAVESLRFEPCVGAEDVCELLVVDPGRPTTFESVAVGTHASNAASTPKVLISQSSGADDVTVLLLDGDARPLAAWHGGGRECYVAAGATTGTEIGFELRSPDWESRFYRATFDRLPTMPTEPIGMLTAAQQEGVGAQAMGLSDSTMAIVLQPGGVYWMFQDGERRRRGGPLEPEVSGVVSNRFALVGERLYWGYPGGLATTARFDAPGVPLRTPPEGFEVVYVHANEDDLVWVEYDGSRAELWRSPLAATSEELVPTRVTTLPVLSDPALGERLVAFVQTEPKRMLVADLEAGNVREWSLPTSMDGMRILYVNREEVGFSTQRNPPSVRFHTFARVRLSAFEPIE